MTDDADTRPDEEIERRLTNVLHILASDGVPAGDLGQVPTRRHASRVVAAAAVAILVLTGIIGIAAFGRGSAPTEPADGGTPDSTIRDTVTTVAVIADPVASTVVLPGPFPIPSNETINPDLDEYCTRMHTVIAALPLGSFVPQIAKAITAEYGTDTKMGCEIYFGGQREAGVGPTESDFAIAWLDETQPNRGPTEDADETRLVLSSGRIGFVDPTGDDDAGLDDDRVVSVPQPGGGVVFVHGFAGTSIDLVITVADQFDQALTTPPVTVQVSTTIVTPDPSIEATESDIVAAAAVARLTTDNSFGGAAVFDQVNIVNRYGSPDDDGHVDVGPDSPIIGTQMQAEVERALAPMQVIWVSSITDVIGTGQDIPSSAEVGPVLTLSSPIIEGERASITTGLWCGSTCGAGGTYIVRWTNARGWTVAEIQGPQWES